MQQPCNFAQMQKQLPPTPHQPSIPPPLKQPVKVKMYFSTNQQNCWCGWCIENIYEETKMQSPALLPSAYSFNTATLPKCKTNSKHVNDPKLPQPWRICGPLIKQIGCEIYIQIPTFVKKDPKFILPWALFCCQQRPRPHLSSRVTDLFAVMFWWS